MCKFCENIDEMHIIEDGYFKGGYLPSHNENQIVKDKDKFHIWSDGGGDSFQCGICVILPEMWQKSKFGELECVNFAILKIKMTEKFNRYPRKRKLSVN